VCENHPHKSWEGTRACNCGDASAQWCNQSEPSPGLRAPWWPSADDPDGSRQLRPRTAFLKKAPAIGDGCQSREETLRNVSRFAGALCVAIHTCVRKLREPPGTKVRRGPESAPFTVSAWRASWVERARRPFWLYRQMPGDRARRSVLFEVSSVRRGSWQAYRASADLLPGDRRLLSEAPASQPARPSVMSRPWKSRTRQAIGSTAAALPLRTPISFAHSTHTQYPWIVVPRVLRTNYDRQPGLIRFLIWAAVPMSPRKPPGSWRPRRTLNPAALGCTIAGASGPISALGRCPLCSFKIPMIFSSETRVAP
jgi:hypothetical protein